jgi:hypothetical protein
MVQRRTVITGTVLGGALSALTAPAAAAGAQSAAQSAAQSQATDQLIEEIARAVKSVRDEIEREYTFWEIEPVRAQMRTFLRANSKFPDFIEVGTDVWQQVYDWHVRFQHPLTLGRSPDGRYTILLLATNVVMRPDMAPGYIGLGYDNR